MYKLFYISGGVLYYSSAVRVLVLWLQRKPLVVMEADEAAYGDHRSGDCLSAHVPQRRRRRDVADGPRRVHPYQIWLADSYVVVAQH